jgi:hypothetical protein
MQMWAAGEYPVGTIAGERNVCCALILVPSSDKRPRTTRQPYLCAVLKLYPSLGLGHPQTHLLAPKKKPQPS